MSKHKKDDNVWFDGVDKKLLEVHCEQKELVNSNEQNLITSTPLMPFNNFVLQSTVQTKKKINPENPHTGLTKELALDCEMVECFHYKSVLARISIVNLYGHPVYDKFVAPPSKVTDYRTKYSGIRRKDLVDAPSFATVQKEVIEIIKNRIVVGHAIHNDFAALKISHPTGDVRDTSNYYKTLFGGHNPSLKRLSERLLGIKIQSGEHDSVQDAQATMKLFVLARDKWNTQSARWQMTHKVTTTTTKQQQPKRKKLKTFFVMS